MENNKNQGGKTSVPWGMGTAIGICAGVGIVLGAIMGNMVFWLLGGAAAGTVLGAVTESNRKKR